MRPIAKHHLSPSHTRPCPSRVKFLHVSWRNRLAAAYEAVVSSGGDQSGDTHIPLWKHVQPAQDRCRVTQALVHIIYGPWRSGALLLGNLAGMHTLKWQVTARCNK